jgi:hypothetical protein
MMGLDPDWAVRAITAVGNYGEVFERNIGAATPHRARPRAQRPVVARRPDVRAALPLIPSRGRLRAPPAASRARPS